MSAYNPNINPPPCACPCIAAITRTSHSNNTLKIKRISVNLSFFSYLPYYFALEIPALVYKNQTNKVFFQMDKLVGKYVFLLHQHVMKSNQFHGLLYINFQLLAVYLDILSLTFLV